jgi:hypothetical protein
VVREELRRLLRRPVLLVLPLAVAGLAYGLLGFNAGLVDTVQGHDPYGAGLLASVRADGLNLYTSGFACGQLLSFLFGAGLVALDRRPVRVLRAKLLTALGVGTVLALCDLTVVLTAAPARAPAIWHRYGLGAADQDLLHDPVVRCGMVLGAAGFPLWAALGVGIGALLAGWPTLTSPTLAVAILTTCILDGAAQLHSTAWASLAVALLPPQILPPSTLLGLFTAGSQPYRIPVAVAGTAGSAVYIALLCYAGRGALRRRVTARSPSQTTTR